MKTRNLHKNNYNFFTKTKIKPIVRSTDDGHPMH